MANMMQGITHIAPVDSVSPANLENRVIIRDTDGANFSMTMKDVEKVYGLVQVHKYSQSISGEPTAYTQDGKGDN